MNSKLRFLACVLLLGFSACGSDGGSGSGNTSTSPTSNAAVPVEAQDYHWIRGRKGCVNSNNHVGLISNQAVECGDDSSANLQAADLHGQNLRGANLSQANFAGADLTGTDFRGADISSANLFGGAKLTGALFSPETKLPFSASIASSLGMVSYDYFSEDSTLRSAFENLVDGTTKTDDQVLAALQAQGDPNAVWSFNLSAKNFATFKSTIRTMIHYGLSLSAKKLNFNPVAAAVTANDLDWAKELIADGANVNELPNYGNPPIHDAVARDVPSEISALVGLGADPNLQDSNCVVPVQLAISLTSLQTLLSLKASLKLPSCSTGLIARWYGNKDFPAMTDAAVLAGASMDYLGQYGYNIVSTILQNGDVPALTCLIRHGLPSEFSGENPHVSDACAGKDPVDTIPLLKSAGANVDAIGAYGNTPLMDAVELYPNCVQPLLNAGANVNAISPNSGKTAIFMATDNQTLLALLAPKSNLSIRDNSGQTAIYGCTTGDCVNTLVHAGLDLHSQDSQGRTPLLYSIENGGANNPDALSAIFQGSNLQQKDNAGHSAKDYVMMMGVPALTTIAQKYLGPIQMTSPRMFLCQSQDAHRIFIDLAKSDVRAETFNSEFVMVNTGGNPDGTIVIGPDPMAWQSFGEPMTTTSSQDPVTGNHVIEFHTSNDDFKFTTWDLIEGTGVAASGRNYSCSSVSTPPADLKRPFYFDCGANGWLRVEQGTDGKANATLDLNSKRYSLEWYQAAGYPIFDQYNGYSNVSNYDDKVFVFLPKIVTTTPIAGMTVDVRVFSQTTPTDWDSDSPHTDLSCVYNSNF